MTSTEEMAMRAVQIGLIDDVCKVVGVMRLLAEQAERQGLKGLSANIDRMADSIKQGVNVGFEKAEAMHK